MEEQLKIAIETSAKSCEKSIEENVEKCAEKNVEKSTPRSTAYSADKVSAHKQFQAITNGAELGKRVRKPKKNWEP